MFFSRAKADIFSIALKCVCSVQSPLKFLTCGRKCIITFYFIFLNFYKNYMLLLKSKYHNLKWVGVSCKKKKLCFFNEFRLPTKASRLYLTYLLVLGAAICKLSLHLFYDGSKCFFSNWREILWVSGLTEWHILNI